MKHGIIFKLMKNLDLLMILVLEITGLERHLCTKAMDSKNKTLFSFSENVGVKTNNEAEYLALIKGVELCIKNNISNVLIFADSELVVKQINGDYKVKNERMAALHKKTHDLLKMLSSWEINHVLRDKNTEADDLSKQGLSK